MPKKKSQNNNTNKTNKTKKPTAPRMTIDAALFDATLASLRSGTPSAADRRKELLAQVAGSVAAGLVTAPSPSIAKPESMATVAVDIAEEILRKAGIEPAGSAEESAPPVEQTVGAAS